MSDGGECLYLICTRALIWGARRRFSPRNLPSRAAATPLPSAPLRFAVPPQCCTVLCSSSRVQHCTFQFFPNNPQCIPFPMLHCKRHIALPQCYTAMLCTQNAAHCTLHFTQHTAPCPALYFNPLYNATLHFAKTTLCFAKCTQCTL